MLDTESSLRINLLRFPLIVGVVFIHNYEVPTGLTNDTLATDISQSNSISELVRYLFSQGISGVAVPTFFLMSGYLFFAKFVWSKENYVKKLKSRVNTLLIPFLFWNIATLLLIALGQSFPATQGYFSGKTPLIASFSSFDYMSVIFGVGRNTISYQFWFIRDLMLLVLLAPIIHYFTKKIPFVFLLVLFVCWFLDWTIQSPSTGATLFFSAGCFLGITKRGLFCLDKYGKIITVAYATVVLLETMMMSGAYSHFHKVGAILGIPAALFLTKPVAKSQVIKQTIISLGSASFFVYAAHEPLLSAVRKIAYKTIQPNSDYSILALYFAIPILVIIFLVMTYGMMTSTFPKFTRVITGGR